MTTKSLKTLRGWTVGDLVCVHGKGYGRISRIVEREDYPGDYVVVDFKRSELHERSGKVIEWTEHEEVLLDVYPAHLSKSSAYLRKQS